MSIRIAGENRPHFSSYPTQDFKISLLPSLFKYPTMLAPMEGVTSRGIRDLLASFGGIGVVCTEFVRISEAPLVSHVVAESVSKTPMIPLSVQIMGNDAMRMAEAAEIVCNAGAEIVDINLGCPTRRAIKGGVGAAMLKDTDLLYDVLAAMRKKVSGLFSAKMRAGLDNTELVLKNAQAAQAAGVDFLVVHPRKRTDQYKGVADCGPSRTSWK